MSIRATIAGNTVFNALGRLWEAAISLLLMIYIVNRLDFDGYGLWSLVAAFTGYAALLDFGVSSAFTKYIAEYAARDDRDSVSSVIGTGFFFYLILGLILFMAGWPLIDGVMALFMKGMAFLHPQNAGGVETGQAEELRFLFRGALVLFLATNCIAPFSALPSGLQRMGITNLLSFCASLVKTGAIVFFLENGFGVPGLLYANAIVLFFFGTASVLIAFYIYPGLRPGPGHVTRPMFRILLDFGWKSQVAKLSNLINFQTDRVIIGLIFADLTLVGLYRAGEDLATKFRQLPALVVSAMIPAVSDLDARQQHAQLNRLYLRSTKYIAVVTVPLMVYMLVMAEPLMHILFSGRDGLDTAAWVMRIIVLGYAANLLPGPGVSIALGRGDAGMPMKAGILAMAGNLVLTIVLVMVFGFYGVPAATAIALLISTCWFFLAMRRHADVPIRDLLAAAAGWPLIASLPGGLMAAGCAWYVSALESRLPNLLAAGAGAAIFGLIYVLLLRLLPFLDAFDADFLENTLRLGRLPGIRFLTGRARHAA
jgi:O-antigen/teichoic acid export membrane protein